MYRKFFVIFSFLILVGIAVGAVCVSLQYSNVSFLVLFQNNYELRPTGGFLGSYGRLSIDNDEFDLSIQDIYVPDGQMDGHVDPPRAIQTAFGQGWYKLRDSNFDPDFPTSAKTMQWFFEKGKEKSVDGVIAINLEVFKVVLDVVGPIALPDEDVPLTSESFYQLMQSEAEIGFFPGSQQKQVYLSKVGRATLEKLRTTTIAQKIQLGKELLRVVRQRHIFVYANDPLLQKLISVVGFDGSLERGRGNYFSLIEANLGTNKSNCCIKRNVELRIEDGEKERNSRSRLVKHTASITYTNENPATLKNPPYFWGGAYINYLRVYVPIEAESISVAVSGRDRKIQILNSKLQTDIKEEPLYVGDEHWEQQLATHSAMQIFTVEKLPEKKLQSVELFIVVDALKQETVEITYTVPQYLWSDKTLFIQKQGGVEMIPYTISTQRNLQKIDVLHDTKVSTSF